MAPQRSPSGPSPRTQTRLRVFRIEPGTTEHLRALDESYGGLMTHYGRSGSSICLGDRCSLRTCLTDRTWKGYASADLYLPGSNCWLPVAWEITEAMELDLRGLFRRGAVWKVSRAVQTKRHKTPAVAAFVEMADLATLPPAFDVRPTLMHMYHTTLVNLSVKNPLPPRPMCEPTFGAPPPGFAERKAKDEEVATTWTPEQIELMKRNGVLPTRLRAADNNGHASS